ncbi:hypothetical protein BYT27DRAFT_7096211, partial [Phlegmacium glaucopus]
VSLTCDAWQASNADGYFTVTSHWIEEPTPAKWELKSFTRLNNAHNGEWLGQALFKIIERVGIENKVSDFYTADIPWHLLLLQMLATSHVIMLATIRL